ncbi:cytochrome subunit of sulfide dehydrogenase [Burkholderiales bacterium]|nr:cytochrome subunit of sulfide dehydrogenase [Burkholderiales bacterium]
MKAVPALMAAVVLLAASFHVAAQPKGKAAAPAQAESPAGVDLKRAEQIVAARCSLCHGNEGESASPVFPRLAGQHPEYIAKQLDDFQSGRRKGTMNDQAKDLTADEMRALGVFFGRKKPLAYTVRDEDLAAVGRYIYHKGNSYSGVAACASCHGPKGDGTIQLPRLAGQHAVYLESQLKEFDKRERTNDNAVMHAIASKLTELETRAVALYVSGMK